MYDLRTAVRPATVTLVVDGRTVSVPQGSSVAVAVFAADMSHIRRTPVSGAPRLPYCMMGVCFDCLTVIDGVPNQQSCMVPASEGMQVNIQEGPRSAPGVNHNDD